MGDSVSFTTGFRGSYERESRISTRAQSEVTAESYETGEEVGVGLDARAHEVAHGVPQAMTECGNMRSTFDST